MIIGGTICRRFSGGIRGRRDSAPSMNTETVFVETSRGVLRLISRREVLSSLSVKDLHFDFIPRKDTRLCSVCMWLQHPQHTDEHKDRGFGLVLDKLLSVLQRIKTYGS